MTLLYPAFRSLGLTVWLLFGLALTARATHIVGGELELQYRGANAATTHQINLNLYFDNLNGNPNAKDQSIIVAIFRKRDNTLMGTVQLFVVSDNFIAYTVPACSINSLSTRRIRYSRDVSFTQSAFDDPGGYYMTWERCCRNNSITNINNPGGAGSMFYLEFPNLWSSGKVYANSSPVFGEAKGDYICLKKPFTFDFSAKDPDGDSLAYSLVTPYNGFSDSRQPNPGVPDQFGQATYHPGPYPDISWLNGYSATNAITGSLPLRVDAKTGRLSVIADRVGLYVFCVLVKEYRAGKQIGSVRRDFQLKVIDCPANDPPVALLRQAGQTAFYKEGTVISINEKEQNCLTLYLTDPNANQRLTLTTIGTALPGLTITPGQFTTRTSRDTATATVCFGRCAGGLTGRVALQIVVSDEGCPQPLQDTLTVQLNITPELNHKPVAATDLTGTQSRTVTVGSSLTFTAIGSDIDNDGLTLKAIGRGFDLTSAGMSFTNGTGTGKVTQPFTFKPICSQARAEPYLVDFVVFDTRCNRPLGDTVTVQLTAKGLPSRPPTIQTTLPQSQTIELSIVPGDTAASTVHFGVIGDDPDRDSLLMFAVGRGFDYQKLGMKFAAKTGRPTLQSPFSWLVDCSVLQGKNERTFTLDFIDDDRSCQPNHTDTTTVVFHVKNLATNVEIVVPNVFTPNNDGVNDYFAAKNIPPDNCTDQFRSVVIVNRWGRQVFSSTDRNFRWYGEDFPVGEYLYAIEFTQRTIKGHVTLLR